MSGMRSRRKSRKSKLDEATRIALSLLPIEQVRLGGFQAIDVANHTDRDQRHMVRSGEKRTIRRRTHVEKLKAHLGLEEREAAACQWYADAHAARYDTVNVTAAYDDAGRTGRMSFDHLPSNSEQERAAEEFDIARSAIQRHLRPMFERAVLHGFDVRPDAAFVFRLAARQLMHCIEGWVEL